MALNKTDLFWFILFRILPYLDGIYFFKASNGKTKAVKAVQS